MLINQQSDQELLASVDWLLCSKLSKDQSIRVTPRLDANMTSVSTPSEDWQTTASFHSSAYPNKIRDCTTSDHLNSSSECQSRSKKRKRIVSFTLESVVVTRKKICLGKYKIYKGNTLNTQSSKTLAPASTSSGKVCKPFWNKYSPGWSQRLWLPTRTGCEDMEENCWSSSLQSLTRNSWFSVHQQRYQTPESSRTTSSPLPQSLWRGIMADVPKPTENEDANKKRTRQDQQTRAAKKPTKVPAGKASRIRLYPTPDQKKKLMKWFGTVRWTYNRCVEAIQKKEVKINRKALRELTVNRAALETRFSWALEVPYDVRDAGMIDAVKAIKSNLAKKVRTKFQLKFRSLKDPQQSLVIHHKHWGRKRGDYSDLMGPGKIRAAEPLPNKLGYDSRLIRTRLGHYYLCIPQPLDIRSDNQAPSAEEHATIALDPGVRTFMTGYSAGGRVISWGSRDMAKISRLHRWLDVLQKKWSHPDTRHRRRYRLKRAGHRIRLRVRNLVDEIHKRLAKWLCTNFRCILIPRFEASGMISKGRRCIRKKTVRAMCAWSHYRFRQRLLNKAREYPWCRVIVTEEPYTSKTCGQCGWIHQKLGGSKIFRCQKCTFVCDRDVNGARNILLRYLSLYINKS